MSGLFRETLVDLVEIQPARLAVVGGERGVGWPVVALAAEGILQQVQALLCAADPEGDHPGLVARAGVGELGADHSHQLRQSAQVLLQGLQPPRESPGLVVFPLGPQGLDQEVERLRVASRSAFAEDVRGALAQRLGTGDDDG